MKRLILISLIITGLVISCKKYDEGPTFTLRSAYWRLAGPNTLTKYTVDGIDSLVLYKSCLGTDFNFKYHYDETEEMNICMIGSFTWLYKLEDHHKILKVHIAQGMGATGPFGTNRLPEWTILRLTYQDLKMKTNYNGKEYLVEIEKK
jgi:hypothetical protein